MSDSPVNSPETPASGANADAKRRAAIKAGLLAAPAVLTLMARSSLVLADNNGTPGAASAGSTSVVRDNNGNHYGWDKKDGQANGSTPTFAGDPQTSTAAPDATSASSSSASSASTDEASKDKEDAKTAGVGSVSK